MHVRMYHIDLVLLCEVSYLGRELVASLVVLDHLSKSINHIQPVSQRVSHLLLFIQSFSQPASQSISQPVSQPVNRSVSQPASQSASQPASQPTSKCIARSHCRLRSIGSPHEQLPLATIRVCIHAQGLTRTCIHTYIPGPRPAA